MFMFKEHKICKSSLLNWNKFRYCLFLVYIKFVESYVLCGIWVRSNMYDVSPPKHTIRRSFSTPLSRESHATPHSSHTNRTEEAWLSVNIWRDDEKAKYFIINICLIWQTNSRKYYVGWWLGKYVYNICGKHIN